MTIFSKFGVWCHLCPLKDLCPHQQSDACYRVSKVVYYDKNDIVEGDYSKQSMATNNCPLRKML